MEILIKEISQAFNSTAGRLFATEVGIDYPIDFCLDLVRVFTPSFRAAKMLFKEKRKQLADACRDWDQSVVEIFSPDRSHPIPISATPLVRSCLYQCQSGDNIMSNSSTTVRELILPKNEIIRFTKPLLKLLDRVLDNDEACGITRLRDQKQIAISDKFSEILGTTQAIATGRNMKMGWNPAHLDECNRRIRSEDRFTLTYESAFNPQQYGRMTAEILLIDDGVEQYRFNVNQGWDLLDSFPEEMRILQRFDW